MHPFILTLKLAALTTLVLLPLSLILAGWMTSRNSLSRSVIRALIHLPLLLPPSVMGFYLLLAFSPRQAFGAWLNQNLGWQLLFTFPGLLIASILIHLPFMVNPLVEGLKALPPSLAEAARTLGKNHLQVFMSVLLPNIKSSILMACLFTFTHSMGELGVALMIGGKIPGQTQTASIAIYDAVESMNYSLAHQQALLLCGIAISAVAVIFSVQKKSPRTLQ